MVQFNLFTCKKLSEKTFYGTKVMLLSQIKPVLKLDFYENRSWKRLYFSCIFLQHITCCIYDAIRGTTTVRFSIDISLKNNLYRKSTASKFKPIIEKLCNWAKAKPAGRATSEITIIPSDIINELLIQIHLKLLFMPFKFETFRPFLWKESFILLIKKNVALCDF